RAARNSRRRSRRSIRPWLFTGVTANPVHAVGRRFRGSCTHRTKRTTARAARPAVACWPIVHFRACCVRTGLVRWRNWSSTSRFAGDVAEHACLPRWPLRDAPGSPMTLSHDRRLTVALMVALSLLIALGVLSFLTNRRSQESARMAAATRQMVEHAHELMAG